MLQHGELVGTIEQRFDRRVLRRLVRRVLPHRTALIATGLLMLLSALADLAIPYLFGRAIDMVGSETDHSIFGVSGQRALDVVALALLIAVGLRFGATAGQLYLAQVVGQRLVFDLRSRLFTHLQRIGLRYLDRRGVGSVMSRVQNDVSVINELFSDGLVGVLSDLLTLVGIVTVMLLTNWKLAAVSFAAVPIVVGGMVWWRRHAVEAYRATRLAIARLNGHLAESINGIRVIQTFAQEERQLQRFEQVNRGFLDASLRAARLSSLLFPSVQAVEAVTTSLLIGVGGWLLLGTQAFTVGELVTFAAYVSRFYEPIRTLSMRYDTLQAATTAAERIFELEDVRPEVEDRPGAIELPPVRGEVVYDHVTFGYDQVPVLHDITVRIEPGETVALVGETGAGKSTMAALLARSYDVWAGAIRVDGYDLRDVTLRSLRSQLGVVPQDPFLFASTVRDNIAYGRPEAEEHDIVEVARAVGIHEAIMQLPRGYDTPVHERGVRLSVGQRQLITIARVLLADPRIVILDEATAHIDTETEQLVQRAIKRLLSGRTAIVIAHRLSTVRDATRILVLHQGRIVEAGRHDELLAREGHYRRLYRLQFQAADKLAAD